MCYRKGFGQVKEGSYPLMSDTWLTPTAQSRPQTPPTSASTPIPASALASSATEVAAAISTHTSITEFKSLENFAFDGADVTGNNPASHLYSTPGPAEVCVSMLLNPSMGVGSYVLAVVLAAVVLAAVVVVVCVCVRVCVCTCVCALCAPLVPSMCVLRA